MSDNYFGNRGPGALAEGRLGSIVAANATKNLNLGQSSLFQRVVVEEIIFDPSIIDEDRANFYEKEFKLKDISILRSLPANTIIGRHVRDGSTTGGEESQYFLPMFPQHFMMPIKPGEHIWVFYEENKQNHFGFWFCRINEPRNVDDINQTHADRKFHLDQKRGPKEKFESSADDSVPSFDNGPSLKSAGEKKHDSIGASYGGKGGEKAYEKLILDSDAGKVHDLEDVPRYKKRPGDFAIQGSNNTLIVWGTDRTGAAAEIDTTGKTGKRAKGKPKSDKKGKAGTIDVVVGRGQGEKTKPKKVVKNSLGRSEVSKNVENENQNEGDPDFETDPGRFYLSMKTDADKNFNIQLAGIEQNTSEGEPAGIIKTDHVRIIARKTIKFIVQPKFDSPESECAGIVIKSNGEMVFIPSEKQVIKLGGDDADKAILCTRVNNKGDGGKVSASPIMDTMGGVQGDQDGLNGCFATKILIK